MAKQTFKQNGRFTKIAFAAIAALIALAFAAGAANAATLEWKTNSQIDSCACEAQRLTAQISNDGSTTQKFLLTADFDAHANAFSSFIAPSVQIAANSKKTVTLIAAPSCETQNGEYAFTLTAEGSNGIKTSIDGVIRVVECNSLKVNAPIEVPACSGETAAFDVRVANDGEARATGSIVTDLTKNSYTLSETSFDLAAGAEKTVTLRVTIPSRTPPGAIPFKITAVAQGVYAEALTRVTVLDCSGLRILAPNAITVAPSTSQKQNVALRNDAAGDDSFALSLADCPSWIALETKSVSLAASSSGTAILVITPPNEAAGKEFNCTLRARSSKRGNVFEATTLVRVSLPSAAALSIPSNADYCQADGPQAGKAGATATANVSFSVRNKGVEQGTFEITASGAPGEVDAPLASIAPGEAKQFVFTLDLTQAGEYALTIHVKSAFGSTSKTVALRVTKCNSFEATLSPDKTTICPNETKNFTLTVRNTGTRADSYAVTTQAPGFAARVSGYATTIEAGGAGSLIVSLTAPDGATAGEARTLIATVKSNALQQTKNAGTALQIADAQYCAAFAGGNGGSGATGQFTSLYTGLAGFLIALIAGLFVVFFLAGRKKNAEETEETEDAEKTEKTEDAEEAKTKEENAKEEKAKTTKTVKRGKKRRGR